MMNELYENIPYLFPIFFIFMWLFVSFLLSMFGGWRRLNENYPDGDNFQGEKWYFQSIKMGSVNYSNCVNIGANNIDFCLSVLPIFRFAHAPIKIPFAEIRGKEHKGLIFRYVDIQTTKVPGIKIRLFKKQADRIEKTTNGVWRYERRS